MSDLAAYHVQSSATLLDAAERIQRNHARTVVVVDGERAIGVLSEGDILRALLHGSDIRAPLLDFVAYGFKYLRGRDDEAALALFRSHGIGLVPVVDDEMRLRDVITLTELLPRVRLTANGD